MKTVRVRRKSSARTYRQGARALTAAQTHRRIADAFIAFMREKWLDEITLDDVARAAGVTVQTVIRRYGGKRGLLEATAKLLGQDVRALRMAPSGDLRGAMRALVNDYESNGDLVIRLLAQEGREPALEPLLTYGRGEHRKWVEQTFADVLARLAPEQRRARVIELIVLTDVYTWKLLRRDQGLSVGAVADLLVGLAMRINATS